MKKLTIEFIKEQFEKEGYTLVSTEYIDCHSNLYYTCPKGHPGNISWSNFKSGSRCAKCFNTKLKTSIRFIKEQFEKEGYILISTVYIDNKHRLDYICPEEHEGNITWNDWIGGHRCKKCFYENNTGKNNPMFGIRKFGNESPNWNPSLTDEDRQDRREYPEYKEWKITVFKKANYMCEICGDGRGGNLEAHHKNSYRANPDQRTLLENGVCLCETCHKNFHHQYGYGDNTEEQFLEFKKNN